MTMRMLIDARHREETRVAVVQGNRVEEFDFESAERKQLKGNIYLAKVTRVEPSLQAAFVDYGGNRHGFLAFSEIHPDYYQIPKEDREALLREEAEHAAEEEALRAREEEDEETIGSSEDETTVERYEDDGGHETREEAEEHGVPTPRESVNGAGGDDHAVENLRQRRMNLRRRYKIQDVIRRRQVLLVQVVKEERGNKGAALTTYLSLAGRYCVLMPNTSHGGGISRKISNVADRKRLKSIMSELNLPKTMGCIVRTAGLSRTKTEIKRDFDYLARLWDQIRETTLQSSAPALVYGDSDLIKRAIRDIYNRDIDEVIVEGAEGFAQARAFMKMLMPSHAKKVLAYNDAVPLFQRFGVEDQLAAMYHPLVQLKSGGYLVINPTEALVSIDINSGRSTREHNIEQTALSTNLEAAHEIARQLRLRDMAGLVVIDFIDMENSSSIRKVEKAMKEALKNDRARIQVGRISSFGLFEMSRQRLRTGVLEASTRQCPHCEGTGLVRTASSSGLSALRMLEDEAARGRGSKLQLRASQEAAFYVLNRKRSELAEIEERYGVSIEIMPDGTLEGARMSVESSGPPPAYAPKLPAPVMIEPDDDFIDEADEEEEDEEEEAAEASENNEERGDGRRRRRRRRRRGGGRNEEGRSERTDEGQPVEADANDEGEGEEAASEGGETLSQEEGEARRRRSRRGRRGGRRRAAGDTPADGDVAGEQAEAAETSIPVTVEAALDAPVEEPLAEEAAPVRGRRRPRVRKEAVAVSEVAVEGTPAEVPVAEVPVVEEAPKPRRGGRRKMSEEAASPIEAATEAPVTEAAAPTETVAPADETPKPRRSRTRKAAAAAEAPTVEGPVSSDETITEAANDGETSDGGPPRRGWWQRTFGQ
jgi:ribonuclease E